MNKLIKLTSIGFVALAFVATSCSDDDNDDPKPNKPVEPSIENVFSEGVPAQVGEAKITTNEQGQVTKIVDGSEVITFEYGNFSRATDFNAKMTVRDNDYPDDGSEFYLQLNAQGFITYALQVYLDAEEGEDTWKFEYNADGQLTRLQRSEGGDDFKITYTAGDITKVVQDEEDGDHREYTISYTNADFKSVVANKGNVMLFDDFFCIDMDEMGVAYFAGLLGKSTKNLPMGYSEKSVEGGDSYTYGETYHWEFNSADLPTKFQRGDNEWDAVTFVW